MFTLEGRCSYLRLAQERAWGRAQPLPKNVPPVSCGKGGWQEQATALPWKKQNQILPVQNSTIYTSGTSTMGLQYSLMRSMEIPLTRKPPRPKRGSRVLERAMPKPKYTNAPQQCTNLERDEANDPGYNKIRIYSPATRTQVPRWRSTTRELTVPYPFKQGHEPRVAEHSTV